MRPFILSLLACSLPILACGKGPETIAPDSPLASELKLVERQVSSLREAILDARKGELFPAKDIAIGVSQETIQKTLQQALPIERPIANDFRARIERAEVSFLSMQGAVKLEGRVWALADPNTFADLTWERQTVVTKAVPNPAESASPKSAPAKAPALKPSPKAKE